MKYPLLKVFQSAIGNIEYYIFRSDDEELDLTLEELINNMSPVGMIKEGVDTPISEYIDTMSMADERYPIGEPNYESFSLPFDFNIPNRSYTLDIKNTAATDNVNTYKIYLGGTVISKVEVTISGVTETKTDTDWINENFKIKNSNNILINKTLSNMNTVTFSGFVKVYQFIDICDHTYDSEGVVPSPANGVYVPQISTIETADYVSFYQAADTRKKMYYYVAVAKDTSGNLSQLSNIQVVEIDEDPSLMEFVLECSDDYYLKPTMAAWKPVDTKTPADEIRVTTKDKNLAIDTIDVLQYFDIFCNDDRLKLEGIRNLKVKNIWNVDNRKLFSRPKKAFRAKNKLGSTQSIYCKPIQLEGDIEVMVDKIMILKKDVTLLAEADRSKPIAITDGSAETLKIFVRQGGIYYKDFFLNNYETNRNDQYYRYDENYNKIEIPTYVVTSVTLDSRYPILNINDSCIYGNKYNYTIYIYDETGAVSKPVVNVL